MRFRKDFFKFFYLVRFFLSKRRVIEGEIYGEVECGVLWGGNEREMEGL